MANSSGKRGDDLKNSTMRLFAMICGYIIGTGHSETLCGEECAIQSDLTVLIIDMVTFSITRDASALPTLRKLGVLDIVAKLKEWSV